MKIKIKTESKDYTVYIGSNLDKEISKFLRNHPFGENLFFVIDSKVFKLYEKKIKHILNSANGKVRFQKFVATEGKKNYESVKRLQSKLLKAGYGRDSLLVAIGGGITGDLAGFAAAAYMRGIPFVQIPTTVLAAVDSSVGGKTGINFENGKNLIGAFHQPEAVFIDKSFLELLPRRELLSGLGEMIKYAYLAGGSFLQFLTKSIEKYFALDEKVLTRLIAESVKIKAGVVAQDERESGLRKILNLGHTFAHALEIEQNHRLKHGEAVIIGLAAALSLSKELNLLEEGEFENLLKPLSMVKEEIKLKSPDPQKVYRLMFKDKKKRGGEIKFVLLGKAGMVYPEISAPKAKVISSLKFAFNYFE